VPIRYIFKFHLILLALAILFRPSQTVIYLSSVMALFFGVVTLRVTSGDDNFFETLFAGGASFYDLEH